MYIYYYVHIQYILFYFFFFINMFGSVLGPYFVWSLLCENHSTTSSVCHFISNMHTEVTTFCLFIYFLFVDFEYGNRYLKEIMKH